MLQCSETKCTTHCPTYSIIRMMLPPSSPTPWFRPVLNGFLWMPVRWQGTAVAIVYAAVLLVILAVTLDQPYTTRKLVTNLSVNMIFTTFVFYAICWKTSILLHSE